MSISRCGLQVSRDTTITNAVHDHPRSVQIGCLLGQIQHSKVSHLSEDTVEDQIDEIILSERKDNVAMAGEGIYTASKKFIGKLASIPRGIKRGAEKLAADVSNVFPDSDENARPIFPGEHHQLLKLPNKKFGRGSYSGPGTRIVARLKRGDPPRTMVDQVAQAHDIRYGLASGADDVRSADQKMLRSLERLKRENTDTSFNINPAMLGITGKVAAENFGMLGREAFIDTTNRASGADKALLQSTLQRLEQKGFGATIKTPNTRRFAKTDTFNPGPGTTKTQSLAFGNPLSTVYMKGVPSVDRRQNRTVANQIGSRGVNTRGMFRDGTSGVTQSGDGQHPGAAAPASSSYVNVKTQKGKGFGRITPGASHQIVDVQTGKGKGRAQRPTLTDAQMHGSGPWPERDTDKPGSQLLKKMRGQVKKGKNYDFHGIKGQGKKKRRRKPVYWDEYNGERSRQKDMAKMLAAKILPMVY